MIGIVNIKNVLDKAEASSIETLVKTALLNPHDEVRESAVLSINLRYNGLIYRGFIYENAIWIEMRRTPDEFPRRAFVCEIRSKRMDIERKAHEFYIQ